MVARMRKVIPPSWFPINSPGSTATVTPILDGLLAGPGAAWSYCYGLMSFIVTQARLATASGSFLDMFCADFFGISLLRLTGESDDAFRRRISINLLRPGATRAAVVSAATTLIGKTPYVLEPFNAADTGGYGGSSASEAGGGGGYGTPTLVYGSVRLPFQYLITINSKTIFSRRESVATFIDAEGLLRVAPRHVARQTYLDGIAQSLLEPRAFNLVKDSIGWSRWMPATATGLCRWAIALDNPSALWPGYPLLEIGIYSGGESSGPSVDATAGVGDITGSFWIRIPSDHRLQWLNLEILDAAGGEVVKSSADLTIVDLWQRVSATLPVSGSVARYLSLRVSINANGLMDSPILTQCWQMEEGVSTTSYIPSGFQIGLREADLVVFADAAVNEPLDLAALYKVIAQVSPAGSIAWTTTTG